jgi:putative tryptophan/tyrosine transport system substrate-binding protein
MSSIRISVPEYRWAEGQYDRLPALAAELVRHPVAVLVAGGGEPSPLAAKAATSTIPIVFAIGSDPVKAGLVASYNRPGGNVTGINILTDTLEPKRFGLLHELVPQAATIGFLVNARYPSAESQVRDGAGGGARLDPEDSCLAGRHRRRNRRGIRNRCARAYPRDRGGR